MTKKNNDSSIPRPLNCFLLYRLEKQKEILSKCSTANHRDISKVIAKWWKEASEIEKRPFREKAHLAKLEHKKKYPNYKYNPQKKVKPKRVYIRKQNKNEFTSRLEENNEFMEFLYKHPDVREMNLVENNEYMESMCKHSNVKQEIKLCINEEENSNQWVESSSDFDISSPLDGSNISFDPISLHCDIPPSYPLYNTPYPIIQSPYTPPSYFTLPSNIFQTSFNFDVKFENTSNLPFFEQVYQIQGQIHSNPIMPLSELDCFQFSP